MFPLVNIRKNLPFGNGTPPWHIEFIKKFLYGGNLNTPFIKKEQDAFHDESNQQIPPSLGKRNMPQLQQGQNSKVNLSLASTPRQKLVCNLIEKNRQSKNDFQEIEFKQNEDLLEINVLGSYYGELPEENTARLKEELKKTSELIMSNKISIKSVLLNLHNMDFISSDAIGALMKFKKELDKKDIKFEIAGLKPDPKKVFQVARLNQFFDIYEGGNREKKKFRFQELRLANAFVDTGGTGLVFKLRSKTYNDETSRVLVNDLLKLIDMLTKETIYISLEDVKYVDERTYESLEKLEERLKEHGGVFIISDMSDELKTTRFGKKVYDLAMLTESVLSVC